MYARKGDRLVARALAADGHVRAAEVIDVEHDDGTPPYLVRWSDTGDEALVFPDAQWLVDGQGPVYPPEYLPQTVAP